jgi:hypothetical protein
MLFAHLADDLYPYAGRAGAVVGLLVGLYSYWRDRGKDEEDEEEVPIRPTSQLPLVGCLILSGVITIASCAAVLWNARNW